MELFRWIFFGVFFFLDFVAFAEDFGAVFTGAAFPSGLSVSI